MIKHIIIFMFLVYCSFSKELQSNSLIETRIFQQDYSSYRLEASPQNFFKQHYIYDFETIIVDTDVLKVIDKQNHNLIEKDNLRDMGVKSALILKYSNGNLDTICISYDFRDGIYKNGKYYEFDRPLFDIIELVSPKVLKPEFEWTKFFWDKNYNIYFNNQDEVSK